MPHPQVHFCLFHSTPKAPFFLFPGTRMRFGLLKVVFDSKKTKVNPCMRTAHDAVKMLPKK